mgnify:CR=1 FL=1
MALSAASITRCSSQPCARPALGHRLMRIFVAQLVEVKWMRDPRSCRLSSTASGQSLNSRAISRAISDAVRHWRRAGVQPDWIVTPSRMQVTTSCSGRSRRDRRNARHWWRAAECRPAVASRRSFARRRSVAAGPRHGSRRATLPRPRLGQPAQAGILRLPRPATISSRSSAWLEEIGEMEDAIALLRPPVADGQQPRQPPQPWRVAG